MTDRPNNLSTNRPKEKTSSRTDMRVGKLLFQLKIEMIKLSISSISIICARPASVREIMLGAEEAGVLDSGQYVYFKAVIQRISSYGPSQILMVEEGGRVVWCIILPL